MSLKRLRPWLTDQNVNVSAGADCIVWAFAVIGEGVVMGDRCVIGSGCYVGKGSRLGDDVHLNHGVFLPNQSVLGNRVFIGPNVTFTDDKHPRVNNPEYVAEPPIIEDDANIGAGAVMLPGVRLGKGCTIGAGAVVTRDVPAGETWVGVPAEKLRKWPNPPADGGWFHRGKETLKEKEERLIKQMEERRQTVDGPVPTSSLRDDLGILEGADMPQGTKPKKPWKPRKPGRES